MGSVDTKKYPFIEAWFLRCKQHIPNYEVVCGQGAQSFGDLYKKAKAANIRRENESPYRRHSIYIYIRTVRSYKCSGKFVSYLDGLRQKRPIHYSKK